MDSDQQDEGKFTTADGKEDNLTLASTLKGVGAAVQDISTRALEDNFLAAKHIVYGLKDGGDITEGSFQMMPAIETAKQDVIDGK